MSWVGKPATSKLPTETELDRLEIRDAGETIRSYEEGRLYGRDGEIAFNKAMETIREHCRRHHLEEP